MEACFHHGIKKKIFFPFLILRFNLAILRKSDLINRLQLWKSELGMERDMMEMDAC